jgi:hypothetical protein
MSEALRVTSGGKLRNYVSRALEMLPVRAMPCRGPRTAQAF